MYTGICTRKESRRRSISNFAEQNYSSQPEKKKKKKGSSTEMLKHMALTNIKMFYAFTVKWFKF